MIPVQITQKFAMKKPYVDYVARYVKSTVLAFCERNGFAYSSRIKSIESLMEKIESGRFQKWSEMDDIVGCSIIVPGRREEPNVLKFLDSTFQKFRVNSRAKTKLDPSIFRFDSTRFIGTIKATPLSGMSEEVLGIRFEVQVRTAFEHAWAVTTHSLAYKAQTIDWRNLRLAAQMKASVEQLDNLVEGYQQSKKIIPEQKWPEVESKKGIEKFFREQISKGLIPSEIAPHNWSKFCEDVLEVLLRISPGFRHRVEKKLETPWQSSKVSSTLPAPKDFQEVLPSFNTLLAYF